MTVRCSCGCCSPALPATPEQRWNRPGLDVLGYRMGTFATFRAGMLYAAATEPALRRWTARGRGDHGTALLELWAYVADVLTFYQERIANESFVRTARLRDSVLRLAGLVGYEPAPGVAASALLSFTLDRGKQLELPERLRVKSVPGPGERAVTFETDESIQAVAELNAAPVSAPRELTGVHFAGGTGGVLEPPWTEVALEELGVGDQVLLFADGAGVLEEKTLTMVRRVGALAEVRFEPPIASSAFASAATTPVLARWTRRFRLFGADAPRTYLHQYTTSTGEVRFREVTQDVTPPAGIPPYTFKAPTTAVFDLDQTVEGIGPGTVVVVACPGFPTARRTVQQVATVARRAGPLQATVTRLTLDSAVFPSSTTASLRDVEVFELGRPEVSLWELQPPDTVSGARLLVPAAAAAGLDEGRTVVLDDDGGEPHIAEVLAVEADDWLAGGESPYRVVEIAPPLPRDFDPETARLWGNVVRSTHGETVARERLGTGDAAQPFATFRMAKPRVTHVPRPGLRWGAASTLEVRVAGVRWDEVESFYGTKPRDRVFVTDVDDEQLMYVRFGDGETGARVPTGAEIVARYREGLGLGGLVRAGSLTNAVDRPVGLKAVTNQLPASGAGEQETLDDARTSAPITVRTLGRVVSLRDFADAALESALVAKSRAVHVWNAARLAHVVRLVVAGEGGSELEPQSLADLLADLDARRDPNRLLEIVPHRNADVTVSVTVVERDPKLLPEAVDAAVREKLAGLFAFENRAFGQPVHASDVLAAVQSATGVVGATLPALHRTDSPPPPEVVEHIPFDDDELARLDESALEVSVP
jgi:hypothetical protein